MPIRRRTRFDRERFARGVAIAKTGRHAFHVVDIRTQKGVTIHLVGLNGKPIKINPRVAKKTQVSRHEIANRLVELKAHSNKIRSSKKRVAQIEQGITVLDQVRKDFTRVGSQKTFVQALKLVDKSRKKLILNLGNLTKLRSQFPELGEAINRANVKYNLPNSIGKARKDFIDIKRHFKIIENSNGKVVFIKNGKKEILFLTPQALQRDTKEITELLSGHIKRLEKEKPVHQNHASSTSHEAEMNMLRGVAKRGSKGELAPKDVATIYSHHDAIIGRAEAEKQAKKVAKIKSKRDKRKKLLKTTMSNLTEISRIYEKLSSAQTFEESNRIYRSVEAIVSSVEKSISQSAPSISHMSEFMRQEEINFAVPRNAREVKELVADLGVKEKKQVKSDGFVVVRNRANALTQIPLNASTMRKLAKQRFLVAQKAMDLMQIEHSNLK